MTARFVPPTVAAKTITVEQVLGFGQSPTPFWAAVRAQQLAMLKRSVPFNTGLMTLNLIAIFYSFFSAGAAGFMVAWAVVMAGLALLWAMRWHTTRGAAMPASATPRRFWAVSGELVCVGLSWGALMIHLLPMVSPPEQMMLALLSMAAIGTCGFTSSVMPVAGGAQIVVMAAATWTAIPAESPLAHWLVTLALVTFTLLILRNMLVATHALMADMMNRAAHAEQSEVIALLLNEFEANGSDWLLEVDAEGRLTHVSPRLAEVAGRHRGLLIGSQFIDLMAGEKRCPEARPALRALDGHFTKRRPFRDLVVPVLVGNETRWWSLSGTPKFDVAGGFSGYLGVGSDVTDARRSQQQIAHLARYDPLTGLANRNLMRETIVAMLGRAARRGDNCALMFVDLDRFKLVNDTLGHVAGDMLLREVALRLRQATGAEAEIGRLGGDEFAVAYADCSPRRAEAAARAIVATLGRPFIIDGKSVSIGASVGYAMGPDDGECVDTLLRSADLALYEVKANGRGHACRYLPAIRERAEERRMLEFDLRGALAAGQLSLAFQPVVAASDEHIVGFEALLRWQHPTLGNVPPLKFVPIAEETGQIIPIGAWVIRTACRWAARLPSHIVIAVNLSPLQFEDPELLDIVRSALADTGLPPERLELEITESLFLNEQPGTIAMLEALKGIGIRFALDDFGTGYSSLGYLRKAAFSRIKIDRSFVSRALNPSGESAAIIQAIVALADSLGMATTAEGTETRAEFEVIRQLGCAHVQGYLFGRPMSPEAAGALVGVVPGQPVAAREMAPAVNDALPVTVRRRDRRVAMAARM